jgi:hypothetical protein
MLPAQVLRLANDTTQKKTIPKPGERRHSSDPRRRKQQRAETPRVLRTGLAGYGGGHQIRFRPEHFPVLLVKAKLINPAMERLA